MISGIKYPAELHNWELVGTTQGADYICPVIRPLHMDHLLSVKYIRATLLGKFYMGKSKNNVS